MPLLLVILLFLIGSSSVTESKKCSDSQTDRVHIVALLQSELCGDNSEINSVPLSVALAMEYILNLVIGTDLAAPGVTYDLKIENILCNNGSLATRQTALNVPLSVWKDQQICFSESPDDEEEESLLLGFLGPLSSHHSIYVGEFLNQIKIPMITPSATVSELSDKGRYSSVFRTATSDELQSQALVSAAVKKGWSYVLLVYTDDVGGKSGAEAVEKYGKHEGICFSKLKVGTDPPNPEKYYQDIARTIKDNAANGIIYFGDGQTGVNIIDLYLGQISSATSRKKLMFTSDGVALSHSLLSVLNRHPKQLINLKSYDNRPALSVAVLHPFSEMNLTKFKSYVLNRYTKKIEGSEVVNRWIELYQLACEGHSQCHVNHLLSNDDWIPQVMDAVITYLLAFKEVHRDLCGSIPGVCSALSENSTLFYDKLLNSLKRISDNVTIDDYKFDIEFDAAGEIKRDSSSAAYQMSMAKQSSAGVWTYQTVGHYHHDNMWKYSSTNILPSIYSLCASCDECNEKKPWYVFKRRSSKFIIAGTGSYHNIHNMNSCDKNIKPWSFAKLQAFYYSVDEIRRITGIDFSTLYIDTCYAKLLTHRVMSEIFREKDKCHLVDTEGSVHSFTPNHFVVFIGDSSSGISLAIQSFLRLYNIPQISYGSTSMWLKDRDRYPTFLRNVPSDAEQTRLMIDIAVRNNWKSVGLIYSDTVYGQTASEEVIQHAVKNNICIPFIHKVVKEDKLAAKNLALRLRSLDKSVIPRPLIIFAEYDILSDINKAIQLYDTQWSQRGNIFIASETWSNHEELIQNSTDLFKGTLTLSFGDDIYNWTNKHGKNKLMEYIRPKTPQTEAGDHYFVQFWEQSFRCKLDRSYPGNEDCRNSNNILDETSGVMHSESSLFKHIAVAGLSVAYAIREAQYGEQACSASNVTDCSRLFQTAEGRATFFRLLINTKVPIAVDSHQKVYSPFQENGEGRINYDVYNIVDKGSRTTSKYHKAYTVRNGIFTVNSPPIFYKAGQPHLQFTSDVCPTCTCLRSDKPHQPEIIPQVLGVDKEDKDYEVQLFTRLLIVILILVILLMASICYSAFLTKRANIVTPKSDDICNSVTDSPSVEALGHISQETYSEVMEHEVDVEVEMYNLKSQQQEDRENAETSVYRSQR